MRIRSKNQDEGVAIEMTPIIDMVFLLLIFFLVATTFHQAEREMQIALPFAKASGPISAVLKEMIINVDATGQIFVGGRAVTQEQLGQLIADAVRQNPDQKVTVRGDRNATYAHVVAALDVCKANGIQEPFLDTVLAP